jgi:hypothetical protein
MLIRPETLRRLRKRRIRELEDREEWSTRESLVESRRLTEGLNELWSSDNATESQSDRHRLMSDLVGEPL